MCLFLGSEAISKLADLDFCLSNFTRLYWLKLSSDRINKKRKESGDRLRPVLTTSIITIVAVIPLASSDPTWFPLYIN